MHFSTIKVSFHTNSRPGGYDLRTGLAGPEWEASLPTRGSQGADTRARRQERPFKTWVHPINHPHHFKACHPRGSPLLPVLAPQLHWLHPASPR